MTRSPSSRQASSSSMRLYQSFIVAGFSEYAALWLVGALMKGLPMPDWLEARLRDE